MIQTIRTGVYALLEYKKEVLVIQKGRGPFTGKYDLIGGKIEHGENHISALQREIEEETGLQTSNYTIQKLLTIEEDFVQHTWKGEEKNEHIIAIIYRGTINSDIDKNYREKGGDSKGMKLLSIDDTKFPKTNILKNTLGKVRSKR